MYSVNGFNDDMDKLPRGHKLRCYQYLVELFISYQGGRY